MSRWISSGGMKFAWAGGLVALAGWQAAPESTLAQGVERQQGAQQVGPATPRVPPGALDGLAVQRTDHHPSPGT